MRLTRARRGRQGSGRGSSARNKADPATPIGALIRAALEARQALREMAAQKMEAPLDVVEMKGNEFWRSDTGQVVPLKDVLLYLFHYGRRLIGKGWWCVPEPQVDPFAGLGKPHHIRAYGAQVIEVEVDTEWRRPRRKPVSRSKSMGRDAGAELATAPGKSRSCLGWGDLTVSSRIGLPARLQWRR